MPVIAPALRLFAPEFWGEIEKIRHFASTTYSFDEREVRALARVEGIAIHPGHRQPNGSTPGLGLPV